MTKWIDVSALLLCFVMPIKFELHQEINTSLKVERGSLVDLNIGSYLSLKSPAAWPVHTFWAYPLQADL